MAGRDRAGRPSVRCGAREAHLPRVARCCQTKQVPKKGVEGRRREARRRPKKLRFISRGEKALAHPSLQPLSYPPDPTQRENRRFPWRALIDSPRAARRACSAHTPSPRLAPAPAAPHWSLAAESTRDGSATCSITPMRPPDAHPERPGVGCSQQQESQRDGPSSATDWLHPPLAVHMQNRNAPKIFCVAKANPEHGR